MKQIIITILMLFSMVSIKAQQSIEGLWDTGQENSKIEIKEVDGVLQGFLFSSDNVNAPLGKVMIKELQKDGNNYKGKLYSIKRKQWLEAMFIRQKEELIITISVAWQTKTLTWKKQ